ncbi:MAG: gas vesicle protein [Deltaproteobacteria bacterium]|nr:gas vesicle protein [Deltaproteobacteria bacterium]
MKPARQIQITLTDVLDRLLDKGLIVNADIVISVGGIPLVGVVLRAAVAGMETMLAYGMMENWDRSTRLSASESREGKATASRTAPSTH